MNKREYNRKMKGLNRDVDRIGSEIDTLNEKRRVVLVKRAALILDGWGE